jgi:hypothetical protein
MDKNNARHQRIGTRRGRGLFWGLTLVATGSFWLLGNLEIVPEPARIVIPGLIILWGIATMFTRRENQ